MVLMEQYSLFLPWERHTFSTQGEEQATFQASEMDETRSRIPFSPSIASLGPENGTIDHGELT